MSHVYMMGNGYMVEVPAVGERWRRYIWRDRLGPCIERTITAVQVSHASVLIEYTSANRGTAVRITLGQWLYWRAHAMRVQP